ncbi:hypothetical protein CR969_01030 [Candidatus Saccharibacteria bacterium]|nr:MAG: hypothetical protein CR969_01030 [Candidatus Saccharibacteria bacterium]
MTKILLVEDDKSLREIYGVRLLAEGYDIVSAGDGEEALAMAIKERPSLIVSDVMMPKISGFDMLDILRSTTETKDIKVIMMTALSSEDQRQRGEQLGADKYLVKSQVGIEDVVRTVHEILGDIPGMTPAAPPKPKFAPGGTPAATTATPTPAAPTTPRPATPAPATPTDPAVPKRPDVAALSPHPEPPEPVAPATTPTPTTPTMPKPPVAPDAPVTPPAPNTLPQPAAPFSSPKPRPSNLGDRVIHPLETPNDNKPDVAKLMDQELNAAANPTPPAPTAPTGPAPATAPEPPTAIPNAPSPSPAPAMPSPAPAAPTMPKPPVAPSAPATPPAPAQTPPTAPQNSMPNQPAK